MFSRHKGMNYNSTNETWSVYQGDLNGKPLLVRVNTGVGQDVYGARYKFRTGIAIPFKHPQKGAFPTPEENGHIDKIEDVIFELFRKDHRGLVCAVITTNEMKEFMVYCETSNVDDVVHELKNKFHEYDFQSYLVKDENWDGYNNLTKKF